MTFAVRLDPALDDRLRKLSLKTHRSRSYYVRKGLEHILQEEEDYADAVAAYEGFLRSGEKGLTIDEMRAAMNHD